METRTDRGHRVVVTGLGMLSPVGNDVDSSWDALLNGRSGVGPITQFDADERFDVRFAAEVRNFDPGLYMEKKETRRTDRFTQLALGAAEQAMQHSGLKDALDKVDRKRIGVLIGSGIGGMATFEEQTKVYLERGPSRVSPFFIPMFIADIAAGHVSMRFGLHGPNYATVSACASSAHAIGNAYRSILTGEADAMVAGGSEATVTPLTIAGFASMKALSTRNESPETASRPFDATRDGFVLGEGSAVLILESLEHAMNRGANVLAEVIGYGQTADAYHLTAPAPEGAGAQLAMKAALENARLTVEDVDYINAHGTSTPANDLNETLAVKKVFGEHAYRIVMGSTKSMTGHTLGAAGAIEAAICTKVLGSGCIPPTINFTTQDPDCDLNYAHGGMIERPVNVALSNSFGFGGHNVCLAMTRWSGN